MAKFKQQKGKINAQTAMLASTSNWVSTLFAKHAQKARSQMLVLASARIVPQGEELVPGLSNVEHAHLEGIRQLVRAGAIIARLASTRGLRQASVSNALLASIRLLQRRTATTAHQAGMPVPRDPASVVTAIVGPSRGRGRTNAKIAVQAGTRTKMPNPVAKMLRLVHMWLQRARLTMKSAQRVRCHLGRQRNVRIAAQGITKAKSPVVLPVVLASSKLPRGVEAVLTVLWERNQARLQAHVQNVLWVSMLKPRVHQDAMRASVDITKRARARMNARNVLGEHFKSSQGRKDVPIVQ